MGQLNLPLNALVYVDTAVLIYSVEANPNYRELLRPLWLKSNDRGFRAIPNLSAVILQDILEF